MMSYDNYSEMINLLARIKVNTVKLHWIKRNVLESIADALFVCHSCGYTVYPTLHNNYN